ncbi:MAG: galactosyldiacylglycerol synthase [Myxococcota bacterium]
MPIALYDQESGRRIGQITDEQLATLRDLLEEEDSEDRNYFIGPEVVDYIEEEGGPAELVKLLRDAVGEGEGIEVEWRKE